MITKKKSEAVRFLEGLIGGPLTFSSLMYAHRRGDDMTLEAFASKLGISKQHLNDIEKGRKFVSPERAARFARILGFSESNFIQLALQDQLNQAGLDYKVQVS